MQLRMYLFLAAELLKSVYVRPMVGINQKIKQRRPMAGYKNITYVHRGGTNGSYLQRTTKRNEHLEFLTQYRYRFHFFFKFFEGGGRFR